MEEAEKAIESPVELLALLKDFKHSLDQEQRQLLDAFTDNIETLASRKYQLLRKINSVSPTLLERLSGTNAIDAESASVEQVRGLIEECKDQNRDNGALVVQRLKVCRNSMALLNFGTNRPHTELYDPQGVTSPELTKRDLGQA